MIELKKIEDAPKPGLRAVIYGVDKIGKTSLALTAPSPVFVQAERGVIPNTTNKGVLVTGYIERYEDFMGVIDGLVSMCAKGELKNESIVIDSITAVERMMHEFIVRKEKSDVATMGSAIGGFSKAYELATQMAEKLIVKLDKMAIEYGKNIILTAHQMTYKTVDPLLGEMWKTDIMLYSPKNEKSHGKREVICQWADLICNLTKAPGFFDESGAVIDGRVMVVTPRDNIVAGNRYKMRSEIPLPINNDGYLGWNSLADAIYKAYGIDYYTR